MSIVNSNFEFDFIPARVCDGKELTIKFYVRNPADGKMKRVVKRFNHMVGKYTKRDIHKFLNQAVAEINAKLLAGHNPLIEAETPKAYTKLIAAVEIFRSVKEKEMRSDGFRSYKSYIKKLNTWLSEQKKEDISVAAFNKDLAVEFITALEIDRTIGNRTWNNYMVFYRSLWYWLIEKNYCKTNVFAGFRKKEEEEKVRNVIPHNTHEQIIAYCREYAPNLEIIIDLIRASFIRPAEICRIQIADINIYEKVIGIPKGNAKTKKFRYAYLPDWLCEKLINNYRLDTIPPNYYLVTRNLLPGTKKADTRELDKIWAKMRDTLQLGMDMQLYSYRDTGITALEDAGMPRRVIIKLTDHKTEKMAGKYIGPPSRELIDNVVCKIKE